jgi:glycosyltransferase involved in cell wall biosynthesis
MKVLFPIGSFFPAQSGGPDNTLNWIIDEIIKDKDFQITVVTTLFGINSDYRKSYGIIPNKRKLFKDNYEVTYFALNSKNTFSPPLMKWLVRYAHKFDLLFITSFFNHHSILTAILSKLRNVPFIISPRGELSANAFQYGNKSKRLKFCYIKLFNQIYKNAVFHVTSKEEQNDVKRFFPKAKTNLIPNLISVNSEIIINNSRKNILYLGRLNAIKGIENLIIAYSQLPKDIRHEHKLIIAGTGRTEYKNKLEVIINQLQITTYVQFVGHVEGKEKEKLYLDCKVFVLPSYSENFANVVAEAINLGAYVIASKNTPWKELASLKLGSWIDNKPDTLAAEIQRILNLSNDILYCKSLKALNYLSENFDVKRNVYKYKNMILNTLAES